MVQAQRPHFAAQPSEAYIWLILARGAALVTADIISPSLRTLQLQTIMTHSWPELLNIDGQAHMFSLWRNHRRMRCPSKTGSFRSIFIPATYDARLNRAVRHLVGNFDPLR